MNLEFCNLDFLSSCFCNARILLSGLPINAANAALVNGFTNAITAGVGAYGQLGGFAPTDVGLGGASSTALNYNPFSSTGFDDWLVQGGASGSF